MAAADCPSALVRLLGSDSTVLVQEHAAGALWAMAHRREENCVAIYRSEVNRSIIVAAGAIPPLLELLRADATAVQEQAAGALQALNEPVGL